MTSNMEFFLSLAFGVAVIFAALIALNIGIALWLVLARIAGFFKGE